MLDTTIAEIPKPARGRTPIDHAGQRFGRLIALKYVGRRVTDHKRGCGTALWLCQCDCGNTTTADAHSLMDGSKKSCGCLVSETLSRSGGQNKLKTGESAFNQFFYNYKKSARERGYIFDLSKDRFRELTGQPCYYCGSEATIKFHAAKGTNGHFYGNGIDRIDNLSGYVEGNVRSCCKQCNIAKGVLSEHSFIEWIHRVAARSARFEHGENGAA